MNRIFTYIVVVNEAMASRSAKKLNSAFVDVIPDSAVHRLCPGAPGDDYFRQSEAVGYGRERAAGWRKRPHRLRGCHCVNVVWMPF